MVNNSTNINKTNNHLSQHMFVVFKWTQSLLQPHCKLV